MGYLYPLTKEDPPKYLYNKVCYSKCPTSTYKDSNNNICLCNHGWYYNSTMEETICYEKDSCLSIDYYYHTDTKECILNGCKDNYYRLNFQCYKNECPINTIPISSGSKICKSNLKYCYMNENYITDCSNTPYDSNNL